jgi:hypothetical protein
VRRGAPVGALAQNVFRTAGFTIGLGTAITTPAEHKGDNIRKRYA